MSGPHILYQPKLSPSDEEADKEVAQVCKVPVYYHIRSLTRRRHRYYTYNMLDSIDKKLLKRLHTSSLEEMV